MVFLLTVISFAQNRIDKSDEEITRLKGEIESLAMQDSGIYQRIEVLKREIALYDKELSSIMNKKRTLNNAIEKQKNEMESLKERQIFLKNDIKKRMIAIYKFGIIQKYRSIFAIDSTSDLMLLSSYMDIIADRDKKNVEEYNRNLVTINAMNEAMEENMKSIIQLERREKEAKQAKVEEQVNLSSLRRDIQNKKESFEALLSEVEMGNREIETLIGNSLGDSKLIDLSQNHSSLLLPCSCIIGEKFGTLVHPRFHTKVPHPGIDFDAPPGTPIRSIAPGKVIYASWLSGYGFTVIIDHGYSYLSVYAHLKNISITKGSFVKSGIIIGELGDSASMNGYFLYLEIRKLGHPVDPLPFFQKGSHKKGAMN